jgi:hypothetical protein
MCEEIKRGKSPPRSKAFGFCLDLTPPTRPKSLKKDFFPKKMAKTT